MTGRVLLMRDLQVAEDIGERARLGYFDQEFYFYGTTYFRNGEQYYLISANADRIYDFVQEMVQEDIYCTPVERYVKKCPVPSGTEEYIAHDLKVLLGKQLQNKYVEGFLQEFQDTFKSFENDAARKLLKEWQNRIDGLFDEEKLCLFELLVNQAYRGKVLTKYSYEKFREWIKEVRADMGENLIVKDIYKRDLHSISYVEQGRRRYVINAKKARVYEKQEELYRKNIDSTVVYGKTYWYNHDYRLADARKDYEAYLQGDLISMFFAASEEINSYQSAIDAETYREKCDYFVEKYGEGVKWHLEYYGSIWHCK